MNNQKRLSRASVFRLELYLELLEQMQRDGKEFVTSTDIGETLGIASVSVRQDLFGLASAGRPKIGYEIGHLIRLIRELFDLDRRKSACIVGFGNLGRALAGSNIWNKAGYRLTAVFDNDPVIVGTEWNELRIRSISELFGVIKTEDVEMAVIAVPVAAAQEIADMLVSAGIRAIWNFAPTKLITTDAVAVEDQSLAWGLIALAHRTRSLDKE